MTSKIKFTIAACQTFNCSPETVLLAMTRPAASVHPKTVKLIRAAAKSSVGQSVTAWRAFRRLAGEGISRRASGGTLAALPLA